MSIRRLIVISVLGTVSCVLAVAQQTGAGTGVAGPRFGAVIPPTGTASTSLGFGGFGASMLPPPVPPALPRAGGRRGSVGAGSYMLPVPVYGAGFDNYYRSVHNPPPGTYDPIFGNYNGIPGSAIGPTPQEGAGQPPVVINQYFQADKANPQLRDYSNVNLPPARGSNSTNPNPDQASQDGTSATANDAQFYFLIATKDSVIRAAAAYWVTGSTLNYVDLQGKRSSVSLDQVDRDLSKRLNTGRSVEFELPPQ